MKPKDLQAPFPWKERRPHLAHQVFYCPSFYSDHEQTFFPEWSDTSLFGNDHPVCVEYCSGNGDWIVAKAQEAPDKNWVAVEIQFDRVRKIWSKIVNKQLKNIIVVCGEALIFTQHYLREASIDKVFINFPDPWPKRRHHKHRLIQPFFLSQIERILKPQGEVVFVTDDRDYLEWSLDLFCLSRFTPFYPFPHYRVEMPSYGSSYFERLWREKGKTIHYTLFTKSVA